MCPLCADAGWIQVAPVEDSDGIDYRYVRASRVGTFAPVPCFVCNKFRVFQKASFDHG